MRAQNIWLETDEDGFHLVIEDDQGERHDFNVQGVTDELLHAARLIQEWRSEGYARGREVTPEELAEMNRRYEEWSR